MNALVVLPVLLPLAAMLCSVFTLRQRAWQERLSLGGAGVLVLAACLLFWQVMVRGTLEITLGGWPAPYGILFRIDLLSALMVLVTALMAWITLLYMKSGVERLSPHPLSLPLIHGMIAGVCGAFCTADLFNLYVWYEVMLVCALGLLALGGRILQLDAVFKYFAPNLFGTLLLLMAVGLIYAATGHLQFDALHQSSTVLPEAVLTALLTILLLALLIKSAAFPLYAWLPAAYPALPVPVMALFAGLLTKVGTYAILRLNGGVFASPEALMEGLGWIAVATMVAGVLGAAYHWDIRRILAFHIISQIGYIFLAIALGGLARDSAGAQAAYGAALFYTVHHIIVKANLFLLAGFVLNNTGSFDLRKIGGLAGSKPLLALIFAVPVLSLVGIPPLSGFWAKLLVIREAFAQERLLWAAAALAVSGLTLYSMMKIWMEAFWKPHPDGKPENEADTPLLPAWISVTMLSAITMLLGFFPQALLTVSVQAVRIMAGIP
ncbi:MAG: proton-conducting transporter membrane subunit [bacterium]|nr:proton-conducting transporter membrane subunit [bacterium]